MTEQQFCYWLQGFVEMHPIDNMPTPQQWSMIKEHLATVFNKVTPPLNNEPMDWTKLYPPINPTKAIC